MQEPPWPEGSMKRTWRVLGSMGPLFSDGGMKSWELGYVAAHDQPLQVLFHRHRAAQRPERIPDRLISRIFGGQLLPHILGQCFQRPVAGQTQGLHHQCFCVAKGLAPRPVPVCVPEWTLLRGG